MSSEALQQFSTYPFESDEEFKLGIASLPSPADEDLLLRARIFFFNRRTGNSLSEDDVRATTEPQSTDNTAEDTADTLSFAQLTELITSGKVDQIPNNKLISEELNEEGPSTPSIPSRRKPWEVNTSEAEIASAPSS